MQITISNGKFYGKHVGAAKYCLESITTCCSDIARLLGLGKIKFDANDGFFYHYSGKDASDFSQVQFIYCPYCGDKTKQVVMGEEAT